MFTKRISRSMETSGEKSCAGYVPRARGQPSSRCPEICVTFCGRSCGRRGNTRPRPSSSATARDTRTLSSSIVPLPRQLTLPSFPRLPIAPLSSLLDSSIDRSIVIDRIGFEVSKQGLLERRYWKDNLENNLEDFLYKFNFQFLIKIKKGVSNSFSGYYSG